jgi:hypothetical protein
MRNQRLKTLLALLALLAPGVHVCAQAPPGLLRFNTSSTPPQIGDCVAIQSLSSSGVVVGDSGVGQCGSATGTIAYSVPTTGFAITIANTTTVEVLNPAGTLATGTITMPASPLNGQETCVSSSQTITALTVSANAGQSIIAAPTSMSAGGFCYIYYTAGTTWFRLY